MTCGLPRSAAVCDARREARIALEVGMSNEAPNQTYVIVVKTSTALAIVCQHINRDILSQCGYDFISQLTNGRKLVPTF